MRTFFWWLFVVLAFCPMCFIGLVAAEAFSPRLDALTLHMPSPVRSIVGILAMTSVGYDNASGQKIDRVLRLDPENGDAWSRRCSTQTISGSSQAFQSCTKAVAFNPVQGTYNNLGQAQEKLHDPCAAEDSFNVANMKAASANTEILRSFGRASLECGHIPAAVHEFELAERKDTQSVAVSAAEHEDEEDLQEEQEDLAADRDWLVLAYARNGHMNQAAAMCSAGHPTWKSCTCNFDDKGIHCLQGAPH